MGTPPTQNYFNFQFQSTRNECCPIHQLGLPRLLTLSYTLYSISCHLAGFLRSILYSNNFTCMNIINHKRCTSILTTIKLCRFIPERTILLESKWLYFILNSFVDTWTDSRRAWKANVQFLPPLSSLSIFCQMSKAANF